MANVFTRTGVEQTGLQGPDLSSASFSREGVVDRSAAVASQAGVLREQGRQIQTQAISNAVQVGGQIIEDVDTGFALADIEADVEGAIQEFKASRDPNIVAQRREDREAAAGSIFANRQMEQALFSTLGEEGVSSEETIRKLDELAGSYRADVDRFKAAEEQGVMTQAELELKVMALTREAVNRRPRLRQQLVSYAEDILNLSGAREQARFEDQIAQAEAKQQADLLKNLGSQLDKHNIPYDRFNPDVVQMQNDLHQIQIKKQSWDHVKNSAATREILSKEEGLAQVRQFGIKAAHGAVENLYDEFRAALVPGMPAQQMEQIFIASEQQIANNRAILVEGLSKRQALNTEEGKQMLKHYDDSSGAFRRTAQRVISGEIGAEALNNTLQSTRAIQEMRVRDRLNLSAWNTIMKMPDWAGSFASKGTGVQSEMIGLAKDLMTMSNSPEVSNSIMSSTINPGKNDLVSTLGLAGKDLLGGEEPLDPQSYENMMRTAKTTVLDNPHGLSPEDRLKTLDALVKDFKNPNVRSWLNNATPQTKQDITDLYLNYAQVIERERIKAFQEIERNDQTATVRFNPQGFIEYSSNNRVQAEKLQRNLGARTNDLIQAHAVLWNVSTKQASDAMREVFSGKPLEGSSQERERENKVVSAVSSTIKEEEGFRSEAYLDQAGVPTIGFGFTAINGKPVEMGQTMSRAQAEQELEKQIESHSSFKSRVEANLTPEQEQALASFEYNLGSGIWDTTGKKIIEAINSGDLVEAADIMQRHNKVRNPQTGKLEPNRGLARRRSREAQLLLAGG